MAAKKKAPAQPTLPPFEGRDPAALAKAAKTLARSKSLVPDLWTVLRELDLETEDRSRLVAHLIAHDALPIHHRALLDIVVAELDTVPAEVVAAVLRRLPEDREIVQFAPALAIALRAARFAEAAFDEVMVAPPGTVRRSGTLARLLCGREVDAAERREVAEAMLLRVSRRALGDLVIPMAEDGVFRDLRCDQVEDLHALLTRVAGDPWTSRHLANIANTGPLPAEITVAGFRRAPLADVEALFAHDALCVEALLLAREDKAKELFALAERAGFDRIRNIATAVGLTRTKGAPPAGVEARWTLTDSGSTELQVAALRRLSPARAGEVAQRTLVSSDDEPDFRSQGLIPVLEALGPWLDAEAVEAAFARAELLSEDGLSWEDIAWRASRGKDGAWLLATVGARAERATGELRAGWRGVLRKTLGARLEDGLPLAEEHDALIDPAAAESYDEQQLVEKLLAAIPAARAERVLDEAWARYPEPRGPLRFVREGLSDGFARRVAKLVVETRGDANAFQALTSSDRGLRPLGMRLAGFLVEALGDEPLGPRWVAQLGRVMDAEVVAELTRLAEARAGGVKGDGKAAKKAKRGK